MQDEYSCVSVRFVNYIFASMGRRSFVFKDIGLIFLFVFAGLYFRRPDAFTKPQLWAEDGPIFLLQYVQYGVSALFIPYAGYLHFIPRLIAIGWGVLGIQYQYIPLFYNYSAFLITYLLAVSLWLGAKHLDIKNKVLYSVCFIFLPLGSDIYMDITNLNWMTALYLINYLLVNEKRERFYIPNLFLLLIVSLTGPFSTLLCPVILLILYKERKVLSFKQALPLLIVFVGGVIQGIFIVFVQPDFYRGYPGSVEEYHLLKVFTNNINSLFFLDRLSPMGDGFRLLICVALLFLVFWLLNQSYRRLVQPRKYVLPLVAIIVFAAFVKSYWPTESRVIALENGRYYFIPYTCLSWIIILGLDKKIGVWLLPLIGAFFVCQHKYERTHMKDLHWKQQIQEYNIGARDTLNILPEGWHFVMPPKNNPK